METERQKHNWGSIVTVIGSWIGGAVMLTIMYNMMISVRDMRSDMGSMANNIRFIGEDIGAMRTAFDTTSENVADMRNLVASMSENTSNMSDQFTEIDDHVYSMYILMAEDLDSMRISMQLMTPSITTIGPNIDRMGYDMNRGVNSFTNPGDFMRNMFR